DIIARLIGQWLSERFGQQFIIENRPGAATNLATEAVVNSPPDGHTLLLVSPSAAINATLYEKLNFNFIRDIAPVAGLVRVPRVMEVNPIVPGENNSGIHCLRQGQSRKGQYGISGDRRSGSCGRRNVQDAHRDQHGSCALSQRRASADRFDWRGSTGLLRCAAIVDRVRQKRQAAWARGDGRFAVRGAARYSNGERVCARLRGQRCLWSWRT